MGIIELRKSSHFIETIRKGYNSTLREHVNMCLLSKKESTNHLEFLGLVVSLLSVLLTTLYSTYTSSSDAKHLQIRSFKENLEDQISSSLTVRNLINEKNQAGDNPKSEKSLWSHVNHSNNWSNLRKSLRSTENKLSSDGKKSKICRYKTIGFSWKNNPIKLDKKDEYPALSDSRSLPDLRQCDNQLKRRSQVMSLIAEPFTKNSAMVKSPPPEDMRNVRFMSEIDIRQITMNMKKSKKRRRLPWIVEEKRLTREEEELLARHLTGLFEDDLMMPDIPYRNTKVEDYLANSPGKSLQLPIENTPRKSMKMKQLKRTLVQHRMRNMRNPNDAMFDPNDRLVKRAREASELLVRGIDKRLLVRRPDFSKSLESLQLLLGTDLRDKYVIYNESIAATYSYTYFHLIYSLSYIYFMCKVTNWYDPKSANAQSIQKSWSNVFSDLIHAWFLFLVYILMTICPSCPKNKFLAL